MAVVDLRGNDDLFGGFCVGLFRDDTGAAFAFGLGFARHRVFEGLGDLHVADFDRLNRDAPRVRFFVERALEFDADGLSFGDHLGEFVAADGFAEVFDFENGLFGVPDDPEIDGVDGDGDGVAGEGGFGFDVADADALIDGGADRIDDADDPEHAGASHALEAAEAEDGDAFPLVGDAGGEEEIEAYEEEESRGDKQHRAEGADGGIELGNFHCDFLS